MAERWSICCLRDFLYIELGKAIQGGSAPRQCWPCGKWLLHEQEDKTAYCARFMKENMSREEFNAWGEQAAERRGLAIALRREANPEEERAQIIEAMREDLNRL